MLQDLDLSAERLDEVIDWLNDNPAMREVSNEIAVFLHYFFAFYSYLS